MALLHAIISNWNVLHWANMAMYGLCGAFTLFILEYFGLSIDGVTVIGKVKSVDPNALVIKKSSELAASGNFLLCINGTTVAGIYDVEADW